MTESTKGSICRPEIIGKVQEMDKESGAEDSRFLRGVRSTRKVFETKMTRVEETSVCTSRLECCGIRDRQNWLIRRK